MEGVNYECRDSKNLAGALLYPQSLKDKSSKGRVLVPRSSQSYDLDWA